MNILEVPPEIRGPPLDQDCGILTIYLKGVSNDKTKLERIGHFIIKESSNAQTPSSENRQTDPATRIRRESHLPRSCLMRDTQTRFDPGAFYDLF